MKLTSLIASAGLLLPVASIAGAAPGQGGGGRFAHTSGLSNRGFGATSTGTASTSATGATGSTGSNGACPGGAGGASGTTGAAGSGGTATYYPQSAYGSALQSAQTGGSAQATVTPATASASLATLLQTVQRVSGVVSLGVQVNASQQSVTLSVGGNGQVAPAALVQAIQSAGFQVSSLSVQYSPANTSSPQSAGLNAQGAQRSAYRGGAAQSATGQVRR